MASSSRSHSRSADPDLAAFSDDDDGKDGRDGKDVLEVDENEHGKYAFPNDEEEQLRLDLYHHIFTLFLDGKLFSAPVENPRRILDVGTGTGIWAIEVGFQFPDARVIGNDLSPIQPRWVPSNVVFEVDDAELAWMQRPGSVDFVHVRFLACAISDWPQLLQRAYTALRPGGWIEFSDYGGELSCDDGSTPADSSLRLWFDVVAEASEKSGRPLRIAPSVAALMAAAGFVDVTQRTYQWPIGAWPADPKMKEVGRWTLPGALDSLSGFSMGLLTRVLGWKKEEVDILVAKSRSELLSNTMHCYSTAYNIVARKPLAATTTTPP
ncbi:S-adenosyl-L-methionine-dependent methyltransferase [Geopyxis carbonaria]|nr:S-adenosyl-L-methionine-dependent methyltransferase [Geopyxis carbonaria]